MLAVVYQVVCNVFGASYCDGLYVMDSFVKIGRFGVTFRSSKPLIGCSTGANLMVTMYF